MVPSASNTILERIAAGDRAAMRDCLATYGGLVWSLARTLTPSTADAEDATQDVFVHLWQRAAAFDRSKGSEVQFISVVARRRLIDWVRKHARPGAKSAELLVDAIAAPPAAAGTSDTLDSQAQAAWQALRELVREQQQVLVLAVVYGLTHEQIATHLSMPLGTVKTNLYRGLRLIREALVGDTARFEASVIVSHGSHAGGVKGGAR